MKLCTYFCHGLEMCMWFGYNPWINFYHFFRFVNFVIFWPQILRKCIDSGYLVSATPYTVSCLSLCNFAHFFFHGLKVCMWFGFNPAVNFCHFSTLLTLSFVAGETSTSPKFDQFFDNDMCCIFFLTDFKHQSNVYLQSGTTSAVCTIFATANTTGTDMCSFVYLHCINPHLPSGPVHSYQLDSILISCTSLLPILGVPSVLFHFYCIFSRYSC